MASHCPPGSVTASDVTQSLQDETQGISFQVLPAFADGRCPPFFMMCRCSAMGCIESCLLESCCDQLTCADPKSMSMKRCLVQSAVCSTASVARHPAPHAVVIKCVPGAEGT